MKSGKPVVQIGLMGVGTVGAGVVKILRAQAARIERKIGVRLVLRKAAVRSLSKRRSVPVPKRLLTTRPAEIVNDPAVHIFVELAGGIHPAKELIGRALDSGKHVVTANKALLAEHGDYVFSEAAKRSRFLGIEASVCGGIPIIRAIREGLAADEITHFLGIVNGTCNYILTRMSDRGLDFAAALKEAQAKGYAEKDPGLDIDGVDSAHKLSVLARLAFGASVPFRSIAVEGIRGISAVDIAYARELGYVVKLLAIGRRSAGGLQLSVHPALLPLDHPLTSVRGVYNAVFVHAAEAGDLLFYGRGAGQMPTASAVMSDVVSIAQKIVSGAQPEHEAGPDSLKHVRVQPSGEAVSRYYLRFQVADKPGVLGRIAQTLGRHGISILSVHQKESHDPKSVPVVILTYEAPERNVRRALAAIDSQKDVSRRTTLIRVER